MKTTISKRLSLSSDFFGLSLSFPKERILSKAALVGLALDVRVASGNMSLEVVLVLLLVERIFLLGRHGIHLYPRF